MAITLRLTDAGRAALADGANQGTRAVSIRSLQLGSGRGSGGADDDSRTALRTLEQSSRAEGETSAAGRIAVSAGFPSAPSDYTASEVGLIARLGAAGADFLFAYWTHPTEVFARATTLVSLVVGVQVDISAASPASVTVDFSPRVRIAASNPPGVVLWTAASSVPAGYLECDGALVSRTTYAALFAAIGTTFGAGDGSTTFGLPNLARRSIMGAGGTATTELGNTVGSTGGAEDHALTTSEIPAHAHTLGYTPNHIHGSGTLTAARESGHTHPIDLSINLAARGDDLNSLAVGPRPRQEHTNPGTPHTHAISGSTSSSGGHSHSIGNTGSGEAHSLLHPVIVLRGIIAT